jgi:transcriptional regulator with XRE-family HTH domain
MTWLDISCTNLAAKVRSPTIINGPVYFYHPIFFTNILRILDEKGLTKSDLASKANISISFLSDLTTGQGNPSLRIMEQIAAALETPLATLLESTDLDKESLDALAGGHALMSLPEGYVRVAVTLTEFQAFQARQWDAENRKQLARLKPKQSKR